MRTTPNILPLLAIVLLSACDDPAVDALSGEVAAIQERLNTLEAARTALEDTVEAQQGTIAAQATTIDEQTTTIAGLETRLATVEGFGDHGEVGYLTEHDFELSPAGAIAAADVDAWNGAVAELDGSADGIFDSRVDLLDADLSELTHEVGGLVADGLALAAAVTGLQTDVATAETNIDTLESSTVGRITSDLTLGVPADHADINEALAWLDGYSIGGDATVEIELASGGTWSYGEEVVIRHPNGDRIHIIGDPADPATITFPYSHGFVVTGSSSLGLLADLSIHGSTGTYDGLTVMGSSTATLGNVELVGWGGTGIVVTETSSLTRADLTKALIDGCATAAEVNGAGYADLIDAEATDVENYGFVAFTGTLIAENSEATGIAARATGSGYWAYGGGIVRASGAEAIGFDDGFVASTGGAMSVPNSVSSSCSDYCYFASYHSSLVANSSNASGCDTAAYASRGNGYIYAAGAAGDDSTAFIQPDLDDLMYGVP